MIIVAHDSQFARTLIDEIGGVQATNSNGVQVVIAGVKRTLDTWRIHDNKRGLTFFCAAVLAKDNETIVPLAYHVTSKTRMVGTATRLTQLASATVDAPKDLKDAATAMAIALGVASLWKDGALTRIARLIFRKGDRVLQPQEVTYVLPNANDTTRYTAHGLYRKKDEAKIDWVLARQVVDGKQIQLWKVKPADLYNATMPADLAQVTAGTERLLYSYGYSYMLGRPIPVSYLLKHNLLFAAPLTKMLTTKGATENEQATESSGATADATASGATPGTDGSGDVEANEVAASPAALSDGNGVHL